ncbi:MAG: hypothetical protein E6J80_05740 [Deltaproteobacteria bacterium]|nr:MAG: hypothetical protein E6J80_05740 [Deltaproteobacteria bacterium]
MPIPYRDADDLDELGTAGYLKIEPTADGSGYLGALFLINARGEPVEFTYNRIDTPHTFLWRQDDLRRHATRKLTASLFSLCPKTPRLLLCLAQEIGSELFCQDLQISILVCRIDPASEAILSSDAETKDTVHASEPVQVFWFPGRPAEDAIELRLLRLLSSHGLLLEPFERASIGLREVYRTTGDKVP